MLPCTRILSLLLLGLFLSAQLGAQEDTPDMAKAWQKVVEAGERVRMARKYLDREQQKAAEEGYDRAYKKYWDLKKITFHEFLDENLLKAGLLGPPATDTGGADNDRSDKSPDAGAPRSPILEEDLRRLVTSLFESYEREDVGGFMEYVHPSFNARDRTGNDYRYSDLPRALTDDFEILEKVQFTVFVGQTTVQEDGARAETEVRWSRKALVQTGGQEWELLDQRSVFQFDRGSGLLLSRIFGDSIFGLADRLGQIVADRGTLDGQPIEEPLTLDRFQGVVQPEEQPISEPTPAPSTIVEGTFSLQQGFLDFDAQNFDPGCSGIPDADFDFQCASPGWIDGKNGAELMRIDPDFPGGLDTVVVLPDPPYNTNENLGGGGGDIGKMFAYKTSQGLFGAFQITNVAAAVYTIRFKHQKNGSKNLR
ncbi:MAG: hypothetical protein HY720_32435 [Planctomycetes bacterium]|nr:hypothetical protein [Planctomycetota bacterium]